MVFFYANYIPVTDVHKHLYMDTNCKLHCGGGGGGREHICVYKCVWCVWCCIVHNYVEIHYVVVHYVCAHVYQVWKTVVVLVCVCACLNGLVMRTTYIGPYRQDNPSSA